MQLPIVVAPKSFIAIAVQLTEIAAASNQNLLFHLSNHIYSLQKYCHWHNHNLLVIYSYMSATVDMMIDWVW